MSNSAPEILEEIEKIREGIAELKKMKQEIESKPKTTKKTTGKKKPATKKKTSKRK